MRMIFLESLIIVDLYPLETCLVLSLIIWQLEIGVFCSWISEFFLGCSLSSQVSCFLEFLLMPVLCS